jgi:hypothetical protein
LPAFDWVNPHNLVPRTNKENDDRLQRAATIEQVHVLPNRDYSGDDSQAYASQPLSK